ncbi:MAG: hypothetical protein AAGF29_08295 [Pseudomonadota bacterium]
MKYHPPVAALATRSPLNVFLSRQAYTRQDTTTVHNPTRDFTFASSRGDAKKTVVHVLSELVDLRFHQTVRRINNVK